MGNLQVAYCLEIEVRYSSFIDNSAQGDGGGIYAKCNTTVNINGERNFVSNAAQDDGGGIYAKYNTTVNINGESNFVSNAAQDDGGGIYAEDNNIIGYISALLVILHKRKVVALVQ